MKDYMRFLQLTRTYRRVHGRIGPEFQSVLYSIFKNYDTVRLTRFYLRCAARRKWYS